MWHTSHYPPTIVLHGAQALDQHLQKHSSKMDTSKPSFVGFVGLGTMGLPMADNLITKLPAGSKIFVYDIFADSVNRFKAQHPDSVVPCASAKEVTENAVSLLLFSVTGRVK